MLKQRFSQAGIFLAVFAIAVNLHGCAPTASLVIGQPDFTSRIEKQDGEVADSRTLSGPAGPVAIYRDTLYVTDSSNNRILAFFPIPATNSPSATKVIQSSDPSKWTNFQEPYALSIVNDKMFVADAANNRVLIWNAVPSRDETPDVVLGQIDLTGEPVGDCSHLYSPRGLFATKDRLIVSEMSNHRVLIWNSIPVRTKKEDPIAADLVLGSKDCSPDQTGSTRHTFYEPRGVWTDETRLVVADTANHRVLIWNRFPSRPESDADIVLGTGKAGSGNNEFNEPYAVTSDGIKLFISDKKNNRVLIWDRFPSKDGDLPARILGGGDPSVPTKKTLYSPQGLFYKDKQLWVTDTNNNRVLRFEIN